MLLHQRLFIWIWVRKQCKSGYTSWENVQCNHERARSNQELCARHRFLLLCYGNFIPLTSIYCKRTSATGRHAGRKHPTLRAGRGGRVGGGGGGERRWALILDLGIDRLRWIQKLSWCNWRLKRVEYHPSAGQNDTNRRQLEYQGLLPGKLLKCS